MTSETSDPDEQPVSGPERANALPVDVASRQRLADLLAAPPISPLVLVSGPGARPVSLAAAAGLVRAPDLVRVAEPDQGRWSAEALRELVVTAIATEPHHRHVLVLADASSCTGLLWDRLLKLFEDPPAATWFLVVLDELEHAPPAIRSRAGSELACAPAPDDERIAALCDAGVLPASARELVAAANQLVELDALVLADAEPGALASMLVPLLAAGRDPVAPLAQARALASELDRVAARTAATLGSKPTAAARITQAVLSARTAGARARLRTPGLSNEQLAASRAELEALAAAGAALARHVPPAQVLARAAVARPAAGKRS
jgi:hypothetical protein